MELMDKSISYGNLDTFNQEIQKRYAKKEDIEPITEAEILALIEDADSDG